MKKKRIWQKRKYFWIAPAGVVLRAAVLHLPLADASVHSVVTSPPYWGIREYEGEQKALKTKDLCLIPFRVALAAQNDGWWVRSIVVWEKSNPVPRAVQGRPKEIQDHILILSKSDTAYWDEEAFAQPGPGFDPIRPTKITTVWKFPTQEYAGAHFATFPEELPTRCILASTSEHGCCPKCGAPWRRIVDVPYEGSDGTTAVAAIGLRRRFILSDVAYQDLQLARIEPRLAEWESQIRPKLT